MKSKAEDCFNRKREKLQEAQKQTMRLCKKLCFNYFQCGSQAAKGVVEYFHKPPASVTEIDTKFKGIFRIELPVEGQYSITPIPALYEKKFQLLKIQAQDDRHMKYKDFIEIFRKWFYVLSENSFSIINCVKEKLQIYSNNNPDKYDKDLNLERLSLNFSASIALSHRVFNYIQHDFIQNINFNPGCDESDDALVKYIFDNWKDYSLNVEDITFINILLSCRYPSKKKHDDFIKYAEIKNFMNNDLVAIPQYDKCLTQLFQSTSFDDKFIRTTSKSN